MTADKARTRASEPGGSPAEFRIRCRLTRDLAQLTARLDGLTPLEPEARRGDEADRIQARDEHDLGVAERARLQAQRALLLAAVARLQEGRYGLCLECGRPIAPARLKALPEVERCVTCQGMLERATPAAPARPGSRISPFARPEE